MVKFSRNPSPISIWGCCGERRHPLNKKKKKKRKKRRTRIPFFPAQDRKPSDNLERKKAILPLGADRQKCGTRLLRFCWGSSYAKKLKDVSISTYKLEMMHNWPGRSNPRVHIYGPIGRSRLIETWQQLKVATLFSRNTRILVLSGEAEFCLYHYVYTHDCQPISPLHGMGSSLSSSTN